MTEVATASVLTTGKTVKIGESGDDAEKWTAENNPLDAVEFKGFYEVVNIDGRTAVSFSTKKGDTFSDIIMCYDLSAVSSERTSRVIDKDGGSASMEKRKREGYF